MDTPLRRLEECLDPSLVGGKAAGLARLRQAGFRVPACLCIVSPVYQDACRRIGIDPEREWRRSLNSSVDRRRAILSNVRGLLLDAPWPAEIASDLETELARLVSGPSLWAVRSSATNEDAVDTSVAGLYRTELGLRSADIVEAVRRCWASLWEERVFAYFIRREPTAKCPAMAVILQPLLAARAAGVAFSRSPFSDHTDTVLINAVPGLAEPLVSGQVVPDEYVIEPEGPGSQSILTKRINTQRTSHLRVTPNGVTLDRLPGQTGSSPALTDDEAIEVAGMVRSVEKAFGRPMDVEWAYDEIGLWLLQARPTTGQRGANRFTTLPCAWSRANFKETFPEVPSPLGLSFLERFMEEFILRHYRELGCHIPPELQAVRIVQGRPFINVTLFQSCLAQLGRQHDGITEQMGGASPLVRPNVSRLPFWTLLRGLSIMHRKIGRALRYAPLWFEDLKRTASLEAHHATAALSARDVLGRMESLGRFLQRGECTFAIVAAVALAQQVLGALLPQWLGPDWRSLLSDALQGRGRIISARQIHWLARIAELARRDAHALAFFQDTRWEPRSWRDRLAGTFCRAELDRFLEEYGHRAIGESDVMSPRFSEDPSYVLGIIRGYIFDPPPQTSDQAAARQAEKREAALAAIRQRLGWRYDRWIVFRWWFARLSRACELREANRHALMYYSAATRRLALSLGRLLTAEGRLSRPEDVFFLTIEELEQMGQAEAVQDWMPLVGRRRAAHVVDSEATVPDFIAGESGDGADNSPPERSGESFCGIPISTGTVEGRVCVVRVPADLAKLRRGDVVVMPVIDPGLVSVFGLAGGLIAEMGGTLSHGAIIAREYGIPAVVNVLRATQEFKDGDRVRVCATLGRVDRSPA